MRMERIRPDGADHEEVWRIEERQAGLVAYVAIHSTRLGPAVGGLRMRRYPSEAEALEDVLRLSRGMTFKNAAAGLPLGGGKSVILGDPAAKSPALFRAFGRALERLDGRYVTAEDMGVTPADMALIAEETTHVAGLDGGTHGSGDPSPVTARGVFDAVRTTLRHRLGSEALAGRRVAVQGLGHVGMHLAALLHDAGAGLVVADPDEARVREAVDRFGAEAETPDRILAAPADLLAPCAIGGILNARTIPGLRVAAVAGAANNQLETPGDGRRLHARGILYAPDYMANAGGVINVAAEVLRIGGRRDWVACRLAGSRQTLDRILARARAEGVPPETIADRVVADRIEGVAA